MTVKPLVAVAMLVSVGCGHGPRVSLPTVETVDLGRYEGRWYEIARLPAFFQRDCVRSEAEYAARPDGALGVRNSCITAAGERRSIEGTARVVDPATNAKLLVTFETWFAWLMPKPAGGNYWILALDPEYETALVGTPDRGYLWILARTPTIPETRERALLARAEALGFDTSRLVRPAR